MGIRCQVQMWNGANQERDDEATFVGDAAAMAKHPVLVLQRHLSLSLSVSSQHEHNHQLCNYPKHKLRENRVGERERISNNGDYQFLRGIELHPNLI